jgi:hypothetical protein
MRKKTGFYPACFSAHRHGAACGATNKSHLRTAARSIISILLLLLVLLQSAGYQLIFKIQQHEIRQEIKQQIKAGVPEAELVLLKIPRKLEEKINPVFQRIHEREFRYCGSMYDIVRQETRGDTTWYYCVSDEKETLLFANLDEMARKEMNQNPQRREQNEKLQRLLDSWFFSHREDTPFIHSAEEVELPSCSLRLKTWIGTPLTPPPEA